MKNRAISILLGAPLISLLAGCGSPETRDSVSQLSDDPIKSLGR